MPNRRTNHPPRPTTEPLEPRTLLAAAGELDPTFDVDGLFTLDTSMINPPRAIAAQPDGKLLVVADGPARDLLLYRITADGALDDSFNGSGSVTLSPTASPDPASIIVQPDGNILVGHSDDLFQLTRLQPDGSPDPTFGDDGVVRMQVSGFDPTHYFGGFALDDEGRIITVGTIQNGSDPPLLALIRYNPDGTPDSSFDGDGIATAPIFQTIRPAGVAILPDGKIVTAASSTDGTQSHIVLLRFHPDGSPDHSFDGDGTIAVPFDGSLRAEDFVVDSAERWVVGASTGYNQSQALLLRFLPDGSLDSTFGISGKAQAMISAPLGGARRFGIALQPDDKLLLSRATPNVPGGAEGCGPNAWGPLRFDTSGVPDHSFGVAGMAQYVGTSMHASPDVAVLPDGRIAVVGSAREEWLKPYSKLRVVRFHSEGAPLVHLSPEGNLTLSGTDGDDVIEVAGCSGYGAIAATVNGITHTALVNATRSIHMDSGAGNDTVRISGNGLPPNPFSFTVSTGDGDDLITHALFDARNIAIDAGPGEDRITLEKRIYPGVLQEYFQLSDGAVKGSRELHYANVESLQVLGDPRLSLVAPAPTIPLFLTGERLSINAMPTVPFTFATPSGPHKYLDTSISIYDGTYRLSDEAAALLVGPAFQVGPNGTVLIDGDQHIHGLVLNDGNALISPGRHVVTIDPPAYSHSGLRFNGERAGMLDLADNTLVLEQSVHSSSYFAEITAAIRRARNSPLGPWQGPGLTSTAAMENPLTTLAAIFNPGLTHFDGHPVGPSDILISHTWNGDTNLDGHVNADDYFRIDSGFLTQSPSPTYRDGDFNYDGQINADDYFLIDSAFLGQTTPLTASESSSLLASTPTPASPSPRATRPIPTTTTPRKPRHVRPKHISHLFA